MHAAPPLNALRAFEAAARHLSLTKAAQELNVTPGAISHQIRGLETLLGVDCAHPCGQAAPSWRADRPPLHSRGRGQHPGCKAGAYPCRQHAPGSHLKMA